MRLKVLAALLTISFTVAAHAQIASVYVTSSNLRFSNVQTGLNFTTANGYQDQYTSFWASGIGGGVTLNFLRLPLVSLGLDLRGSTRPGTTGADTGFGGIKLGVHPPVIRIKPYIQASGGYIATRTVNIGANSQPAGGTFNNQYAGWEILGGVDYPLVHFIDFRVIEIGGGKGYTVIGFGSGDRDVSLFSINTGLVLHF